MGHPVSAGVAAAAAARGLADYSSAEPRAEPALADYLEAVQHNTSNGELTIPIFQTNYDGFGREFYTYVGNRVQNVGYPPS